MSYSRTDHFFRRVNPAVTAFILVSFVYLLPAISFWPEFLPAGDSLVKAAKATYVTLANIAI
jgi:hypothetical protein